MILSKINDVQPEQKPINDSTADNLQVSPAIGNTNVIGGLSVVPLKLREANAFVVKHHRHHGKVVGYQFALGLQLQNKLVGVAICGRPVGRFLDNGKTIEVLRLCIIDGIKNGCSKLYSACSRVAKEMGFEKIITYTLQSENGKSLIASGWQLEEENVGGNWNSSGTRIRNNKTITLFGVEQKYPSGKKKRWMKAFANRR